MSWYKKKKYKHFHHIILPVPRSGIPRKSNFCFTMSSRDDDNVYRNGMEEALAEQAAIASHAEEELEQPRLQ
jgi:hypothetical protein